MSAKLVLAYSGGLDTSVLVRWVKEKYGYDAITVTADVGHSDDVSQVAGYLGGN